MKHPLGPSEVDGEVISNVEVMANMLGDQVSRVFSAPQAFGAISLFTNEVLVAVGKASLVEFICFIFFLLVCFSRPFLTATGNVKPVL
jgi:hypothetical protein